MEALCWQPLRVVVVHPHQVLLLCGSWLRPLLVQCSLASRHSAVTGVATSTAADAQHGALLRDRGFVVLPDPILSDALLESAAALSRATLAQRLVEVDAIGCDPIEQQYVFSEICHRQRNRWDMRLPTSDPAWAQLCDAAVAAATPVIREAQGAAAFRGVLPLMSGVVVSRPGARVQRFHVDATHSHFAAAEADPTHRIYNIFVPLVDVLEGGDGTEFWPTVDLHTSTRALARHIMDSPSSTLDPYDVEAPACPAGGVMIFDYRRASATDRFLCPRQPHCTALRHARFSLSLSPSLPPAYPNTHHRASTRPPVL